MSTKNKTSRRKAGKSPRRRGVGISTTRKRSSKNRLGTGFACSISIVQAVEGKGREVSTSVESMISERRGGGPRERSTAATAARNLVKGLNLETIAASLGSLASTHRLTIVHRLMEGPAGYGQLREATKLQAGPLYHHIGFLRLAGVVGPKSRDVYELTESGRRLALLSVLVPKLLRSRAKQHRA